jgi:cobalamin-dependent methionine synthase I
MPHIPPAPVPIELGTGQAQFLDNEGRMHTFVTVLVSDPTGLKIVHLSLDDATWLVENLGQQLASARSGIVIAQEVDGGNGTRPRVVGPGDMPFGES